ncbi:LytR family transcriptional regulator [Paenibacillus sp. HJL G12]|uniref:LytR family transcriptional regulator n=1 Tax=Paenibacillus dendrobii TaxID=2691084 RepID=A0A7X3ILM0_9BACL|nr:LCP family protein [Paenibacillus dendrobii]MWV46194.1 LytR family transcriptional regulator [Paenibacillus dendrobii]
MKKRTKIYISLAVILVLVAGSAFAFRKQLAVMAFDLFLSKRVENSLQKSYQPLESKDNTPTKPAEPVVYQNKPFSVMLLGSDQRKDEPARSDTLIYAVVRPKDSKVLLISIPRDTYTEIIGKGKKDKITHAYAFGGQQMSKDTMEAFLDHEVDYYATINFQGLKDAVNALGGVELPIQKDIVNKGRDHEKFTVKANKPIYTGEEALNYVRYREDSDFNRTKRQQVFLDAIANRMLHLDQISKIPDLLDIMGNNFQTDMQPKFIIDLAKQVLTGTEAQISSYTIMGEGMKIDGIYYDEPIKKDVDKAKELIDSWKNPDTPSDQLMSPDDKAEDSTVK